MLLAPILINNRDIGEVYVVRNEPGRGPDGLPLPDDVHTYRVAIRHGGEVHRAEVSHRYGDGALRLLSLAIETVLEEHRG